MGSTIANTEQAEAWNGEEGRHWAANADRYDRSIAAFHGALLDVAAIGPSYAVLDVGCGCGQTTCAAAQRAAGGHAHGIDLSAPMLQRARERAQHAGLTNVTFEHGDAQVHRFAPAAYDLAISRFGAMFFEDIGAAFANITTALRHSGRLAVIAWTSIERNEWIHSIRAALLAGRDLPAPQPGQPGPFALGDPSTTRQWLDAAGLAHVDLYEHRAPFHAGDDASDALTFFRDTGMVRGMLEPLDEVTRRQALDALHATFTAHESPDGVLFDASAWVITAVRR